MTRRFGILILVAGWTLSLHAGCASNTPTPASPRPSNDVKAPRGAEGPLAGFRQLRRGMNPSEVLVELGSPITIKTEMMFTYWYYSNHGSSGPHVVFDTRDMRVVRWQEI